MRHVLCRPAALLAMQLLVCGCQTSTVSNRQVDVGDEIQREMRRSQSPGGRIGLYQTEAARVGTSADGARERLWARENDGVEAALPGRPSADAIKLAGNADLVKSAVAVTAPSPVATPLQPETLKSLKVAPPPVPAIAAMIPQPMAAAAPAYQVPLSPAPEADVPTPPPAVPEPAPDAQASTSPPPVPVPPEPPVPATQEEVPAVSAQQPVVEDKPMVLPAVPSAVLSVASDAPDTPVQATTDIAAMIAQVTPAGSAGDAMRALFPLDEPDDAPSSYAGLIGDETNAPTFQPLTHPQELTIQPDSVLRITVEEDAGLGGSYPVNDLGAIQFGYIGPVILYNMTEEQATEKIRSILLNRDFKTASVKVKILRASYDKCQIAGDVRRPGTIKIGSGDSVSLNNALVSAGGLKYAPRMTRIKIVRGGLLSALAPALSGEVYSLVDENNRPKVPDVFLRNNDVAFVYSWSPEKRRGTGQHLAARWVLVLGEVGQEGFYSFAAYERFTMMNLIFRLGGLPKYANTKAIRVIRTDTNGEEKEFKVNAKEILEEGDPDKDFTLQSGDRIIVPARRIALF